MVYFIRLKNTPYVKIGYTADLEKRLGKMRSDNPHELEVIGTVDGTRAEEALFHTLFSESHHKGDWFEEKPKLAKFLKTRFA